MIRLKWLHFLDPPQAQVIASHRYQQAKDDEFEAAPVHEERVVCGEVIPLVCHAMIQKNSPDGLKNEECLADAPDQMAGLCL